MEDYVNNFLILTRQVVQPATDNYPATIAVRRLIRCKSGLELSVQASATHYCVPRVNTGPYDKVEVMVMAGASAIPAAWHEYRDDNSGYDLYAYIPVTMVNELIHNHGGVVKIGE